MPSGGANARNASSRLAHFITKTKTTRETHGFGSWWPLSDADLVAALCRVIGPGEAEILRKLIGARIQKRIRLGKRQRDHKVTAEQRICAIVIHPADPALGRDVPMRITKRDVIAVIQPGVNGLPARGSDRLLKRKIQPRGVAQGRELDRKSVV